MKEELEKIAEAAMRSGIDRIRSEKDRLVDEVVSLMSERKEKKIWSGYESIPSGHASDDVIPGCLVLEGGSFRGCYSAGVLDVFMENGINLQTTIGTSAGALVGYNYVAGEIGRAARVNLGYRHDSRYFGPRTAARNRGVVGFDFILNDIEEELPFDRERFDDPRRRLLVTVTNCETGQVQYCEKGITPYMAPEPFRGRRNDPGKRYRMAEKLAEIRGLTIEEIHTITMENGKNLYHIER